MSIIPVILSGGSGTRLWPLSRESYPKQFISLLDHTSLFQATLTRVRQVTRKSPVIVTNNQHRFIVAEQLRKTNESEATILLEPTGRNTAPAIAAAAIHALAVETDPDCLLLVLPADHNIEQTERFARAVETGRRAALNGKLVTFGIVPSRPETGYGYIRASRSGLTDSGEAAMPVEEFVEKPDLATARQYLESGGYYWNSGMFLFRADRYLQALEKFAPEMLALCKQAVNDGQKDLDFFRLDEAAFSQCPADSIDYAVMEKTDDACVVPLDAGWSDVGAWSSLWELSASDDDGNVTEGDVITHDTVNSYIHSDHRLVATTGVKDLIVVETADAVLVADKHSAQDVKNIVAELHAEGRCERMVHRKIYRPWGKFDSVDAGERFQVKRITVNPGATLSLQKHHHRAEHWIIVSGTAEITCDDKIRLLTENQSTYIPLGSVHRLANPGQIPLEIIEIQSGSYLGEDDIVRFSDHYGRDNND